MKLLLAALALAPAVLAQTASLTGRVTDSSGALIPGATVVVRSVETGIRTETATNAEGYYVLPLLPPGAYALEVTKEGFRPVRDPNIKLAVQQAARLDLTLEVGAVTETVEVTGRQILLESESATMGQVVQGKQVTELPLLGRNPYALGMLVAGVRPAAGVNDVPVNQINQSSVSINGQRGNTNEYLLDGAPNSAPSQNQPVVYASVDAVAEFKIETNAFSAEYGRAAGGVFNVVTKSGTNELHFTLYDFLRNDKLNANNWFANRAGRNRPPFKFNQFGGAGGAPIIRNRTFVFGSVEFVRWVEGVTFNNTVPTAPQRAGDFTQTRNGAGQVIQIYDPATTRRVGNVFQRDLFPGNLIPTTRFDPVARNLLRFYPAGNTDGNPVTGVNNWVCTDANNTNKDTYAARIDHHFNSSNRIFGRFNYDDSPIDRAVSYGKDNPGSPGSGFQIFERRNGVIEDVHTFTPSLLGTFRYSFTRLGNFRTLYSQGFDPATLGFPASFVNEVEPRGFPVIRPTGYSDLGNSSIIRLGNNVHAWQAQALKTFSSHTLRTGFEYRVIQFNNYQPADASTLFTFGNQWTQGPNAAQASANAGHGLASFLLGIASGSVQSVPRVAQTSRYSALYVQDDWRLTPRLTLNLGLRYDYESPRKDRFDQLANFDFAGAPPLRAPGLNLRGTLAYAGQNALSRYQAEPDRNNIAPRFGIAFKLSPKMVIRSGAGLFFAANTGVGTGSAAFGVSGYEASTTVVTSLDGVTPVTYLSNPFPSGINKPSGNSLGTATLLGQSVAFFERGNIIPYSGQWNFNIQRELPDAWLFEVGYAGSRGVKFPQGRVMNQLPDALLTLGNDLRTQVPNPFFGQISSGPLSGATVSRAQLLRPYPHFDGVTSNLSTWAGSNYHALQTKLEKRYARGLTMLVSYTFSKMIDDSTGVWNGEALGGGGGFQNWNNLRADRSVSELDQTHRFVATGVYELPFGKSLKGAAGKLIKGWEIGAIASMYSGGPLGIGSAVNNTFSQGGGQRPHWTGVSPRLSNPSPDRWFDTTQFQAPPAYTFGNAGRTFSSSRSDGTGRVDVTLSKNTNVTERVVVQFRAEFFNIANTPRFAPPNVSFGAAPFGVVSAMGDTSRIVQFGLKLNY